MTAERREGRGRLSSIDLLPDECEEDIIWAVAALRDRAVPQGVILDQFNARLASRALPPVSKSAFSRWSVRKAVQFRKLDEARAIAADVVAGLGTGGSEEMTVAIGEMAKVAIFETFEGGQVKPKDIQSLARSLIAVTNAQKASAEHRRRLELDAAEQKKKAAAAVAEVGARRGVSPETLREINRALGAV